MKGRFEKRASRAGAANVKYGNRELASLGKVFNNGINQKAAYEKVEQELTVWQIKRTLNEIGCKLYDELDAVEAMLEVSKRLSFNELSEIFRMLESKERLVARFEQFEEYVRKNIEDIRSDRDIKRIKRIFKLG